MNKNYTRFKQENVGKKIAIIYGNCHTMVISEMLKKSDGFNNKYALYEISPIQSITDIAYFTHPVFHETDLFIHQSIRQENRYGPEFASSHIIKLLKKTCTIIAIPNLYHLPMCFFPQYYDKSEYKLHGETVFLRDSIIDNHYKDKISAIVEKYTDEQYFKNECIQENFLHFLEKVREREKDWDIKVLDFIINNYRDHQLFYDPNHPTNFLLQYVTNEILKLLKVIPIKEEINCMLLDSFEMPICESVNFALDLRFKTKKEIRKSGKKIVKSKMDLEQYIKQYKAMTWSDKRNNYMRRLYSILAYLYLKTKNFIHKMYLKIRNYSFINKTKRH